MTHPIFVDRQTLKYSGCRSQFIMNICKFRANIAIGSTPAALIVRDHMSRTTSRLKWEIQGAVERENR